jgi:hypothetical protein
MTEELDREIEERIATEKDQLLHYFVLRGGEIPFEHYEVQLKQFAFSHSWNRELIDNFLLMPVHPERMKISDRGMKIYNAGGFIELYKQKVAYEDYQESLEVMKEETIINQHKLSGWQVKYYWIPFIVSGISALIALAAFFLNWFKK